ncbi:MAG: hypothetical protein ACI3VU_04375 [Faecousia sp.]
MKKLMAIALSLLFLFSLTACGENETTSRPFENITLPTTESTGTTDASATEQTSAPTETEEPTEPTPEEPTTGVEELVSEYYSDAGEYEYFYDDITSNTFYYSYHLPAIASWSDGAQAINQSISETFGALIEEQYKAMEEGWFLDYNLVSWYPTFYNDLLIFVIVAESVSDFSSYGVYCYNQTTGEWLQGSALLEYLYIEEESFLEAARAAAEECFVSYFGDISEEERELYGYDECLAWTVSDENINLENLMFYPDEHGEIVVIARIASMAGADWYYHYIYPELAYG